jgi:hypothetical protein
LKISDIIPTANHYLTVKAIKNTKLNWIKIKSLSWSCYVKVLDKTRCSFIISIDEESYKFFNDLCKILCDVNIIQTTIIGIQAGSWCLP